VRRGENGLKWAETIVAGRTMDCRTRKEQKMKRVRIEIRK
jgi:hypothetical protein